MTGHFLSEKGVKHLMVEHIGYDIFRHSGIIQPPIHDDYVMGGIKMSKGLPTPSLTPGDLSNGQVVIEIVSVEFSENRLEIKNSPDGRGEPF